MSGFFTDAELRGAVMLVAIAGASGTGKTRSALLMAKGMAGGDMSRVYVIDSEARRALHHAPLFHPPFKHADMRPPFRPDRFIEYMQAAVAAGALAIVVDNFSDEKEGEGGLDDWAAKQGGGPDAWRFPKAAHKKLVNWARQSRVPIIFCLRAEERIKIVPNPEKPGRTMPVPIGWVPVAEKRFLFDMTVSITLAQETRGAIRYDLPMKLPDQLAHYFPDGGIINEETGRSLAAWLDGAGPPPPVTMAFWPMAHPGDGSLLKIGSEEKWLAKTREALEKISTPDGLVKWRNAMDEHLITVEQAAPDAADEIRAAIEARMDALAAEAQP